jgi:hypothetical protein
MSLSDFVIHIDENLDDFDVNAVEDAACACDGVVSAHISEHHPHLMTVAYDPGLARPAHILGAVRTVGLHGQLIGL